MSTSALILLSPNNLPFNNSIIMQPQFKNSDLPESLLSGINALSDGHFVCSLAHRTEVSLSGGESILEFADKDGFPFAWLAKLNESNEIRLYFDYVIRFGNYGQMDYAELYGDYKSYSLIKDDGYLNAVCENIALRVSNYAIRHQLSYLKVTSIMKQLADEFAESFLQYQVASEFGRRMSDLTIGLANSSQRFRIGLALELYDEDLIVTFDSGSDRRHYNISFDDIVNDSSRLRDFMYIMLKTKRPADKF